MAATTASLALIFFFLTFQPLPSLSTTSPYLYHTTLFKNYQKMLTSFKIFVYATPTTYTFTTPPPASLFHTSLLSSPFITHDPNEAHLFFVPFSPDLSTRSVGRLVRELRLNYPYWNRTLGADHFYISPNGIDYSSDRSALELKKNGVQISVFPTVSGLFVPHKDVTLPPITPSRLALPHAPLEDGGFRPLSYLGYMKWDGKTEVDLVNELKRDSEFTVVESDSEPLDHAEEMKKSKFCLFLYRGDMAGMVEAMAWGCVPVVIVDRPIQDLPLMDVLRWGDMVLLVGSGGGIKGLKRVLRSVSEEKYVRMRELGVAACKHLVWNEEPEPLDAFHMVIYQLWLRRHTIRYARRD